MSNLPWFRLYAEAVDDEKLRLVAFEDRWHFIAILCCKAAGVLDGEDAQLRLRKVAVKLGLDLRVLGEVARRLGEVGLICAETLQPLAWDDRQFKSDHDTTAADRQRRKRMRDKEIPPVTGASRVSHADVTRLEQNRADTEQKKSIPRVPRSAAPAAPAGVSASLWADWLAVRKAKKQPLTATALEAVRNEAQKASLSLADAIRMSVENGWAGFKHSWLLEAAARSAKAGAADSSLKPWHETASGVKAMGAKLGIDPENFCMADGRQDWQAFAAAVKKKAGVWGAA